MRRFIQIGGHKEQVELDGWGQWELTPGRTEWVERTDGAGGYDPVPHWLAKTTITTRRRRIVVGEFLVKGETATALFSPDREDGPFITRIGGANIEVKPQATKIEKKHLRRVVGEFTDEERSTGLGLFQIQGKNERGEVVRQRFDDEGWVKGQTARGVLVQSPSKKPAMRANLADGCTVLTHSWIEFATGERFSSHVEMYERIDAPMRGVEDIAKPSTNPKGRPIDHDPATDAAIVQRWDDARAVAGISRKTFLEENPDIFEKKSEGNRLILLAQLLDRVRKSRKNGRNK